MAFSLKKLLTGAVAQVNPFDNGQTYATVQRSQPAPPPATLPTPGQAPSNFKTTTAAPNRSTGSRLWDQVNPFDSGRSYGNATPKVKDPFAEAQKLNIHDFTGNNTKVNDQVMPDRIKGFDGTEGGFDTDHASLVKEVNSLSANNKKKYVQNALMLAQQGNAPARETLTVLGRMGALDEDATGISETNPLINFARTAGKGLVGGGATIAEGFNKTPGLNAITPIFTAGDPGGREAAQESIQWGKQQQKQADVMSPTGVGGATRMAANMAPVLAATAVNPTAALATGYGQGTGGTYQALKDRGASEDKARAGGIVAGIPMGVLSYFGAKGILNPGPVTTGLVTKVAGEEAGAAATNLIAKTSGNVITKTATNAVLRTPLELATGAGNQVVSNAAMNVGGVKTNLLEGVPEAAKSNLIQAQVMGVGLDAGLPVIKSATTKLVKSAPEVAARAMENPATRELTNRNSLLQQAFENTSSPRQRAIINKQIAANNNEIRSIKQGGYVRLSSGDDVTPTKTADDYAMSHRPSRIGATADDITTVKPHLSDDVDLGTIPKDFYDHPEYYADMSSPHSKESFAALQKIRNNPDGEVTVYRAGPKDELNGGDWISLSKKYAEQEAQAEGTQVHAFKAKASEVQFSGDDINEFGFFPHKSDATDTAIQTRLKNRPENLRKIEESSTNMPDSERLALANGDSGQAGLQTDAATRDSLLARTRAMAKAVKDKTTPLNEGGYFRTPGGGKDFSDGSLIDNTPEATVKSSPKQQELPIVGPKLGKTGSSKDTIAQKDGGFAEGVQRSGEVSESLKSQVKDAEVKYTGVKNENQQKAAEAFVKKGYKKAATDVQERLQAKAGSIDDQTVADSIAVIKRLDENGSKASLQQATDIVERLSEHLTKSGQTIQAASLLQNRTPQGLLYGAIKTLKGAGVEVTPELQAKLQQGLKAVKATKAGTHEGDLARHNFIEMVNKNTPSSATGKAVQIWKAGLLSAPTTTAGNLTANTLEQVVKRGYVDVVQTGIDQIFSAFTGQRSKSLTGRGILSGAKEGALKGVEYFKTGYDPRNPNSKFDIRDIHYSDKPLGKAAEAYTQGIFRLMGSQDQPFYYASMRNSLADQAITAAKNAGLKGPARSEFIKKFVTEPSTKAMELANTEAKYDVFQNETALGKRATQIKRDSALGDFLIPFSGVPSSIATRIIERTPIGAAHEIVKQVRSGKFDQRKMTQALANGTTGVVMAGAGAALVGAGEMTLSYPQDDKERKLWELEGKQAYSVKIGNKWVSLNYFQPAGVLMAAGGAYKKATDEGKSPTEALSIAAANTGKAFTEQTFLKGVSGALNAVNDPTRAAGRFLESTAGSVVPNFFRSIARSTDDKQREVNGVLDSVKGGIPGVRKSLLPQRGAFGEEETRPSSGINSFINPARPSDIKPGDNTTKEVRRLYDAKFAVMPTDIEKTTFGADSKLTDEQVNQLNGEIKPKVKQAWDTIIADPRYNEMNDEEKQKILRDASETIMSVEKKKFASEKQIGAYSPSLSAEDAEKKQKLTAKEKDYATGSGVDFLDSTKASSKKTPREEYDDAQKTYDKESVNYTDVEKTRKQKELSVKKVKADYDSDTVDLHSMSKADLWDYVSKSDKGKDQLNKVIALDDALVAAGIYDKSKYRDKYGNITVGPKKAKGSGSGKGKKTGSKKGKYDYSLYGLAKTASASGTEKTLQQLLKNARLG